MCVVHIDQPQFTQSQASTRMCFHDGVHYDPKGRTVTCRGIARSDWCSSQSSLGQLRLRHSSELQKLHGSCIGSQCSKYQTPHCIGWNAIHGRKLLQCSSDARIIQHEGSLRNIQIGSAQVLRKLSALMMSLSITAYIGCPTHVFVDGALGTHKTGKSPCSLPKLGNIAVKPLQCLETSKNC